MYGLAFFGFVVIAVICYLFVPRASLAVAVLILAGELGWVDMGPSGGLLTVFVVFLTIIFVIVGLAIDLIRNPIWKESKDG